MQPSIRIVILLLGVLLIAAAAFLFVSRAKPTPIPGEPEITVCR